MLMGTNCTRNCRFCNVAHNNPTALDPLEPKNISQAVKQLALKYVVVTSVTRDDLPDGGASHFALTIKEIRLTNPTTLIEVLIPDFLGSKAAIKIVTDAKPNVISHNMETVKSLYSTVRPQAEYARSLMVLKTIKQLNPSIKTKSGIMLGLGETSEEIKQLFFELLEADTDFLTIGQYLQPTAAHIPVQEYITPAQFEKLGQQARLAGFKFVASAPLVRSSFNAGEAFGLH
jgi:lipoic acid synthetase